MRGPHSAYMTIAVRPMVATTRKYMHIARPQSTAHRYYELEASIIGMSHFGLRYILKIATVMSTTYMFPSKLTIFIV